MKRNFLRTFEGHFQKTVDQHEHVKFLLSISRILPVYKCKCCNLIGWAIAHYQPLVCIGWNSSTKRQRFSILPKFWRKIKILRRLNEGHSRFLDLKNWNYWKNDVRICTASIFNANSIRVIFFKVQNLVICQEITGNCYLKKTLVKILLKHKIICSRFLWGDR